MTNTSSSSAVSTSRAVNTSVVMAALPASSTNSGPLGRTRGAVLSTGRTVMLRPNTEPSLMGTDMSSVTENVTMSRFALVPISPSLYR